jgi:hypothetical protein
VIPFEAVTEARFYFYVLDQKQNTNTPKSFLCHFQVGVKRVTFHAGMVQVHALRRSDQ